jgi:hypothetical protein
VPAKVPAVDSPSELFTELFTRIIEQVLSGQPKQQPVTEPVTEPVSADIRPLWNPLPAVDQPKQITSAPAAKLLQAVKPVESKQSEKKFETTMTAAFNRLFKK